MKKEKQKIKPVQQKNPISRNYFFYALAAITIITFISYWPSLKNEFTNWDDDLYVTENPHIKELSAESIKGFFTRYQNANYHPLTFVSLAIDYHFSELNPFMYHFVNVLLHTLNSVLVFWLVYLLFSNIKIATVAGVLFGVHTLHVESVAWVSERKDVLYGFFFLLSLCYYVLYIRDNKQKYLFLSLVLFVLSALSKGQAVSLAVTVVLIDILWKRKLNNKKVIFEKVGYFIIAFVFGLVAINAQKSAEAIFDNASSSFFDRILFASYGFVNYFMKLLYPYKLSALYPYPLKGEIGAEYWLSLLVVLGIIIVWIRTFKKAPKLFFSLAFFMVNVFLVLQLIPVGNAIMADRYSYLPSIGFFIMIGIAYDTWASKKNMMKIMTVALVIYTSVLVVNTSHRSKIWKNSLSLWTDTVEKSPTAEVAWNNLGSYQNNAGEYTAAIANYDNAIKVNPLYADAFSNRGMSKKNIGDFKGAIVDLDKSLQLKPNSSFAYSTKGVALTYLNDLKTAYDCFNKALELDKNSGDAYSGRGVVRTRTGDSKGGMEDLNRSLQIRPGHPETLSNRGISKAELGDTQGALVDFTEAIRIKPNHTGAYLNRGLTYMKMNQMVPACENFYKSQSLGSKQAETLIQRYCMKKSGNNS